MNSDPDNMYLWILMLIFLTGFYGYITCISMAIDKASKSKIKNLQEEHQDKGKYSLAVEILERPLRYIFPLKLVTLLILTISVVLILQLMDESIKLWVVAGFLVAITIFGELFPWKVALQHREGIIIKNSTIIQFFYYVFFPIFIFARTIANIFLRVFKQDTDVTYGDFSEEDIISMLDVGRDTGNLKEEGHKMINSIFDFDDELAYEIMTPRTDVFTIDISESTSEYIDKLMELKYSRIPVYENDYDNIIGILHIKDFLIKARETGFDKVNIREILRPAYFVPDTKNIDSLFLELQKGKQHIAILIDEYGGFSGIVTVEDIIEEIVGEIDDEFDDEGQIIEKVDEANYIIDGNVYLSDLSEEIGIELDSENSETIGGFIIDILGEIPDDKSISKEIEFENFVFTILAVKDRRIKKVMLHINKDESSNEEEE